MKVIKYNAFYLRDSHLNEDIHEILLCDDIAALDDLFEDVWKDILEDMNGWEIRYNRWKRGSHAQQTHSLVEVDSDGLEL